MKFQSKCWKVVHSSSFEDTSFRLFSDVEIRFFSCIILIHNSNQYHLKHNSIKWKFILYRNSIHHNLMGIRIIIPLGFHISPWTRKLDKIFIPWFAYIFVSILTFYSIRLHVAIFIDVQFVSNGKMMLIQSHDVPKLLLLFRNFCNEWRVLVQILVWISNGWNYNNSSSKLTFIFQNKRMKRNTMYFLQHST